MDDFKIIYRLLKAIIAYEKAEEKTLEYFTPERMKTTAENRDRLLIKLMKSGYVEGICTSAGIDNFPDEVVIWNCFSPSITIKGMEYLEDNSMMKKAAALVKGIRDMLPM